MLQVVFGGGFELVGVRILLELIVIWSPQVAHLIEYSSELNLQLESASNNLSNCFQNVEIFTFSAAINNLVDPLDGNFF